MIVLDTNVVSELMRLSPDPAVEAWVARQAAASLFLSAISEAELRYGVAIMPAGRRRDAIAAGIEGMLTVDFTGPLGRLKAYGSSWATTGCQTGCSSLTSASSGRAAMPAISAP